MEEENFMTKKIIIGVVVIFIVLVIGVPYAQNKKVEEVTTADMDFELLEEGSNNYQICGLWDDDNKNIWCCHLIFYTYRI